MGLLTTNPTRKFLEESFGVTSNTNWTWFCSVAEFRQFVSVRSTGNLCRWSDATERGASRKIPLVDEKTTTLAITRFRITPFFSACVTSGLCILTQQCVIDCRLLFRAVIMCNETCQESEQAIINLLVRVGQQYVALCGPVDSTDIEQMMEERLINEHWQTDTD